MMTQVKSIYKSDGSRLKRDEIVIEMLHFLKNKNSLKKSYAHNLYQGDIAQNEISNDDLYLVPSTIQTTI